MSQKPLTQRLDEIDAKMSELIEINKITISSTKDFDADIKAIRKEVNIEITDVLKDFHSISFDWSNIISYCNKNKISPKRVLFVLRTLRGEE